MAITFNLPIKDWYYDTTSEGTLDYPPLFAAFEYLLALIVHSCNLNKDGALLALTASQVRSETVITFQKTSVILSDIVYYLGVYKLCKSLETLPSYRNVQQISNRDSNKQNVRQIVSNESTDDKSKTKSKNTSSAQQVSSQSKTGALEIDLINAIFRPDISTCIALLLLFQPGLYLIDHIHFQYNGLLSGILLLSIASIVQGKYISGSFLFSLLLNMKHIYLYCAPAFGMYLLTTYCFAEVKGRNRLYSFILRAGRLGSVVLFVFVVTYIPFMDYSTIRQVFTRLFPFKRGLTHAYWAPNIWALYNVADKVLATVFEDSLIVDFNLESISKTRRISSTSGIVQEYEHQYLPSVKPSTTFLLVGVSMLPIVVKFLLSSKQASPILFLKGVALTSFTSFMFGWHVHEKAIITVLLPLVPLSYLEPDLWSTFLRLTLAGTYSLFPLLFKPAEYLTKVCLLVAYFSYARSQKSLVFDNLIVRQTQSSKGNHLIRALKQLYPLLDHAYMLILILNELYFTFIFGRLDYDWNPISRLNRLEFLPLMSTSTICALGLCYSYLEIYYDFLLSSSSP